jgi:cation diffusion facilitator CzcD-associated flavoprotein CzcO
MSADMDGGTNIAIVGGGLTGFVAYLTLRAAGVAGGEIAVFSPEADPAAAWRRRAAAIRQTHMRSESDGHCLPTAFPGLAVQEALRRRSIRPLVASVCDRYHPTVDVFLAHVERLRRASGWSGRVRPARIGRVRAVDGGFELDGHGAFQHVLLATGHPGLAYPDELRGDERAVHAYEPHDYAASVCVVGAGLAAATEWLNALAAGSRVISVRRREPVRRPLNVPRPYLSRRGLASFHRLPAGDREALLRELLAPSYPPGREWDEPLRSERFSVEAAVNGADQVICATGFLRGFEHEPLLAALVAEHELPTVGGRLVLAPDSSIAALTDDTRTLALAGVAAQWAYPAADTLMGARYAAHHFARRCRTR